MTSQEPDPGDGCGGTRPSRAFAPVSREPAAVRRRCCRGWPAGQRRFGRDHCRSSRPLPGIRHCSNQFHGAAVDELQRSVEDLGLKGATVHGLSRGRFVDDEEFWLRRIDLDENLKEGIFSRNAAALLGL